MAYMQRLTLLALLFLLTACALTPPKPLRISANLWIGYTPLFYIKERGWFKGENIELVNVVSLYENMQMYAVGNADAFTGTQYEYHVQRQTHPSLSPVLLLDLSRGGDLVMGSVDLQTLRKTERPIDVWLEVDSVNQELFKAFVEKEGIGNKKFRFHNLDPESISKLPFKKSPTLLVTYKPYDDPLRSRGYRELLNTADPSLPFKIVDALYADAEDLQNFDKEFKVLNRLVARALHDLHKDPKSFYHYVKNYLQGEDYAHFLESLKTIDWIYGRRDKAFLEQLQKLGLPTETLMEPVSDAL
jgi:NitT/TauT family transport system substrate-binding protein